MYPNSVPALISKNVGNTLSNYKTFGNIQYNAKDFGAKGDKITDDTSAIQTAILAAYAAGGGTVYLNAGHYKITSNLYLHIGVRIVGETFLNNNVFTTGVNQKGSWLYCYDTVAPAITMASSTKIQNIGFFYPEQATNAAPTAYPPTIKTETSHVKFTIQEVMLQNSYIGIECNTSHENLTVQDVQGLPLYQGIVVDHGSDIDRISNVNFSWNCWYEAGNTLKEWIINNGTAFTIRISDWGYLDGSNCFGYNVGLLVDGAGGFNFTKVGLDGCVKPLVISSGYGLRFSHITAVQYNFFDLTVAFPAIRLSDTDSVNLDNILIGPSYGNGINIGNSKNVNIGNVLMKDFGRVTTPGVTKFGIILTGGNSKITIKDNIIDGISTADTFGIYMAGTNNRINISDNQISNCVTSSIFLEASSNYVIVKNNIFDNSGALADNLGAVTKDIASNMG